MMKAGTVTLALLLTACADQPVYRSASEMATDSENCRATVAAQFSQERESLRMSSLQEAQSYEERYRACMAGLGYDLPHVEA